MKKILCLTIICTLIIGLFSFGYAEVRATDTWVPSSGYASAFDGSTYPDTVFIYHEFSWDSDSRLSGLKADSNETLEMDIVFYNYDGNAYAQEWYNYNGSTSHRGTYWETNQPRPYWDTQASDGSDERVFTVGCSDANLFQKDTLYYWWAYANKNSNGSKAKIVAQRGYRLEPWIYEDTWQVFSEQNEKVVEFSEWTVPSSKSYSY